MWGRDKMERINLLGSSGASTPIGSRRSLRSSTASTSSWRSCRASAWHHHPQEDELFLVVEGRLRIEFRDHSVTLESGSWSSCPRARAQAGRRAGDLGGAAGAERHEQYRERAERTDGRRAGLDIAAARFVMHVKQGSDDYRACCVKNEGMLGITRDKCGINADGPGSLPSCRLARLLASSLTAPAASPYSRAAPTAPSRRPQSPTGP